MKKAVLLRRSEPTGNNLPRFIMAGLPASCQTNLSIGQTVTHLQHNALSLNARLFALLNRGLADAIGDWDTK